MAGKLTGAQEIRGLEGATIEDFWSWAYSDVLSNANRGVFAEFLVASALGLTGTPRVEWNAVDLRYRGKAIEVKLSAYIQSWPQKRPSTIVFNIGRKRGCDAATNTSLPTPIRSADVYVFCLYPETERGRADVLDVPGWHFYVLPTGDMDALLGDQKSVRLNRLVLSCGSPVNFADLKCAVDKALAKG
jgi:hypothetical protein